MMIPGGNLLNLALSVIAKQPMIYSRFIKRTTGENGMFISQYAPEIPVTGSFQPVPRNLYQVMGLDFQKNYANIFISRNILDVERDVAGDQFKVCGNVWQAESKTAWNAVDGWDQVLCVEVPRNV